MGLESNGKIVIGEFTHDRKLPFPEKGEKNLSESDLHFKSKVRSTMKDQYILCGEYQEGKEAVGDIENNLFYNFGLDCFTQFADKGLRFEKISSKSEDHLFHYKYSLIGVGSSFLNYNVRKIAEWKDIELDSLNSHRVWYNVRSQINSKQVSKNADSIIGNFGLKVKLYTNEEVNSIDAIKPVFDGIISAFHKYEPLNIERYSKLSEELKVEVTSLKELNSYQSLLGKRALLTKNLQLNPADDRCIVGELVKYPTKNNSVYSADIEVLELGEK